MTKMIPPADLSIGIIGTGPTALYTLKALIDHARPCPIVLFEEGRQAGPGIPFNAEYNSPDALANIAGVELPPLTETLNQWAARQPARRLKRWGIAHHADDARAFFPRVVLGSYFVDQLQRMLDDPRGHAITVRRRTRVTDVIARADGAVVRWHGREPDGESGGEDRFDRLVIATGYRAPRRKSRVPLDVPEHGARRIGILGTSLSAIDVAVRVARRHGRFQRARGGLRYDGDRDWHVTLMSRSGLLPEADFWFPSPPVPLDVFTDAALDKAVQGQDGDLDRAFALFARQLRALDPGYADAIDLDDANADDFARRYFAPRMAADPFVWAIDNLAEARRSHRRRQTAPWRCAILQMHEPFGRIVPRLSPRDLKRFERGMKRCFTDNYAAVPHLSIRRLLALHQAGVLSVVRLGDRYDLTREHEGWRVSVQQIDLRFDAMADARGQQALGLSDFPFPTLRLQLAALAGAGDDDGEQGLNPGHGYVADPHDAALSRVHCLALPFLLRRNPFIQGLADSATMARECVDVLLSAQTFCNP